MLTFNLYKQKKKGEGKTKKEKKIEKERKKEKKGREKNQVNKLKAQYLQIPTCFASYNLLSVNKYLLIIIS